MSSGLLGPHALCSGQRKPVGQVYPEQKVGMVTVLAPTYHMTIDRFIISEP